MSDWRMKCHYCQASKPGLRRCTRCYTVYYCSRDCQRLDWNLHRKSCTKHLQKLQDCTLSSVSKEGGSLLRKLSELELETAEEKEKTKAWFCSDATGNVKETRLEMANNDKQPSHVVQSLEHEETSGLHTETTGTCPICNRPGCKTKCSRCKDIYYCSRECQQVDWPTHRKSCKTQTTRSVDTSANIVEHRVSNAETKLEDRKESSKDTPAAVNHNNDGVHEAGHGADSDAEHHGEHKPEVTIKNAASQPAFKACNTCNAAESSKMCSGCKAVFYCSKTCQVKDWNQHKMFCTKFWEESALSVTPKTYTSQRLETPVLDSQHGNHMADCVFFKLHYKYVSRETKEATEEEIVFTDAEKRVIEERRKRTLSREEGNNQIKGWGEQGLTTLLVCDFPGSPMRSHEMLTQEQLRVFKRAPTGSLEMAVQYARMRLPTWNIIQYFADIPPEYAPLLAFCRPFLTNVLVAFMFMYHDHVMRHGVYLKDARDQITHVEFYFDHLEDDPFPYFSYDQVRPGNYILIKNPVMHLFRDGQVGLRINSPAEVMIYNVSSL